MSYAYIIINIEKFTKKKKIICELELIVMQLKKIVIFLYNKDL